MGRAQQQRAQQVLRASLLRSVAQREIREHAVAAYLHSKEAS